MRMLIKTKWINNRKVLVTGCSSGLGKELCIQLVNDYNCTIIGIARNEKKLNALKEKLGDKFDYLIYDISTKEAWDSIALDLARLEFDPDIVINNAGIIQPFTQFTDLDLEDVQRVIDVNFMSIVHSCRTMIPIVKKSSCGGIVNVSSASSILPIGGQAIYSATKSACNALTVCLNQELRGQGFYVSSIMPGPIKTDLYKSRKGKGESKAKVQDSKVENIGLTAEKAAKKVIRSIKVRRRRLVLGPYAKVMDFFARLFPYKAPKYTGTFMKRTSKYIKSFEPIYRYEIEHKEELHEKKKQFKENLK